MTDKRETIGEADNDAAGEGLDTEPFADLIGQEFVDFLLEHSPRKVGARIGKALDHFNKALRLRGVDDAMGAIRCIAAEEELVVAVFELLKLNEDDMPEHRDFVKKFKNHYVKLAFYPVLSQFRFVLGDMLKHGVSFNGLENYLRMPIKPVLDQEKLKLSIGKEDGEEVIKINPLDFAVSRDDLDDDAIVEEMLKDFSEEVAKQNGMTVKEFVSARADFRNKLLYATDGGYGEMKDSLEDLIASAFSLAYRDLLWVLVALTGNKPANKDWGLVSQFVGLYRRVLTEAKILSVEAP
ncbi:hypothetical protein [Bradyrhizobium sp. RDI18]|uniref:hypothetical protein n=1 Tax=Bradyrhizobium sp. RDI18 TaxID=3367400 RepID=UPI003717A40A